MVGVLALFFVVSLAPVAHSAAESPEDFEGRWQYVGGDEGRRQIERAIARAVDGMPLLIERIAHGRVRDQIGPFEELRIEVDGDRVVFHADEWGPIEALLDGPPVMVRGPDDARLQMTQRFEDGALVQTFRHRSGTRENRLELGDDPRRLAMSVTISSRQLPRDATYRLPFHRVGSPDRRHATR